MQIKGQRDDENFKKFKGRSVAGQNTRVEANRVYLADKRDPPKSIFGFGSFRHNVTTKDDLERVKSS